MEWCGITGSWRRTNTQINKDVRKTIEKILCKNNGIVTGGALGVDYIATQFVLEHGNPQEQLKIFLPTTLENYIIHYLKRAEQDIISKKQAKDLAKQLRTLAEISDTIITSLKYKRVNQHSYYARNQRVVDASDYLYAFQVNNSSGVQDTIDKAKFQRKKVFLKKYKF